MRIRNHVIVFLAAAILALCVVRTIRAQPQPENMQTFFDSTAFGIRIQVNATAEVGPSENITGAFSLTGQTEVYVKSINLNIFGFLNGTNRILMANVSDGDFSLNNTVRQYNFTFRVPDWVWDTTYGEIDVAHSAKYGPVTLNNDGFVFGFTMTKVTNSYLQGLEQRFNELKQLNEQLNQSYWDLERNFTALQGSVNELDNTRTVAAVLGITTVFFVATTLYLVLRKPREY
jgi:hypothetical protein